MSSISSRLRIFCAGSLRHVLTEQAAALNANPVDLVFGPAGLLRQRIEQGEGCDLFLSANLAHPQTLAHAIPGSEVTCFTRNSVVVVAQRRFGLRADTFLDTLLDPATRIGTSTPGADPGGDYADALFGKAGQVRPGADVLLRAKAQHLVGGEVAPMASTPGHPIGHFLAAEVVDVFFCYRTTALTLNSTFDVVVPPVSLAVDAPYGLVVLATEPIRKAMAHAFVARLMTDEGQARFIRHGFLTLQHGP